MDLKVDVIYGNITITINIHRGYNLYQSKK